MSFGVSRQQDIFCLGKEEYADIECGDDFMVCNGSRSQKNDRPHLFGVGAPLEVSEKNVTFNLLYHDAQSVSHNVGIWVWGAYQVS